MSAPARPHERSARVLPGGSQVAEPASLGLPPGRGGMSSDVTVGGGGRPYNPRHL